MRLLMLRHGQTPANVAGSLDTGAPGPGLTALGQSQAEAVPGALSDLSIDALLISPLVRTSLTAAPLAQALSLAPQTLDGIREVGAGDLEMRSDGASHRAYLETVFSWGRGRLGRQMPGGDDGHAFFDRFDSSIAQIADGGWQRVVMVSHGAAIRCWASARVAGVDIDTVERTPLANTGLVEIEGDPRSGWRLVSWSTTPVGGAHLTAPAADDPTGDTIENA